MVTTNRRQSGGVVELIYGIHRVHFMVAGFDLSSIRHSIGPLLNLSRIAVANVSGVDVADSYVLLPGDRVEFFKELGKKGGDERDEYFLRQPDLQLKLNEVLLRLRRIEDQLIVSNKLQAPPKELYTVEDFAELVDLAPYTVREHCRLGRLNAEKASFGRGGVQEWRIPHAELVRYRNYWLLPLRK